MTNIQINVLSFLLSIANKQYSDHLSTIELVIADTGCEANDILAVMPTLIEQCHNGLNKDCTQWAIELNNCINNYVYFVLPSLGNNDIKFKAIKVAKAVKTNPTTWDLNPKIYALYTELVDYVESAMDWDNQQDRFKTIQEFYPNFTY